MTTITAVPVDSESVKGPERGLQWFDALALASDKRRSRSWRLNR